MGSKGKAHRQVNSQPARVVVRAQVRAPEKRGVEGEERNKKERKRGDRERGEQEEKEGEGQNACARVSKSAM